MVSALGTYVLIANFFFFFVGQKEMALRRDCRCERCNCKDSECELHGRLRRVVEEFSVIAEVYDQIKATENDCCVYVRNVGSGEWVVVVGLCSVCSP